MLLINYVNWPHMDEGAKFKLCKDTSGNYVVSTETFAQAEPCTIKIVGVGNTWQIVLDEIPQILTMRIMIGDGRPVARVNFDSTTGTIVSIQDETGKEVDGLEMPVAHPFFSLIRMPRFDKNISELKYEEVAVINQLPFNVRIYGKLVREWITDIDQHDLLFLCNRSASLYQQVEAAGCVDNYRVSRVNPGFGVSDIYKEAQKNGCCGSKDVTYTNPVTGSMFMIGFNYGH